MSDTLDVNDDTMLWLNSVTGRVHRHKGVMPGGIPPEDERIDAFGVVPCGCPGEDGEFFEEAVENDTLKAIHGRHLKAGIWEPAPCVLGDESNDSDESSESSDKTDTFTTMDEKIYDEGEAPGIEW